MTTRHLRRHARRALTSWRLLAVVAFVAAGALFVTSSIDSKGGDLRSNSVTDLGTLVLGQRRDTDAAQQRVAQLNREVDSLSRAVTGKQVQALQAKAEALQAPAGLDPMSGAGVEVTLTDAPEDVTDKAIAKGHPALDTLVVHQQDLQAVVNALWLGGARGISIMDQRIISTTGIKCAGPTVILHGVPYSPPYVIKAVGDPTALLSALDDSDYIDSYRTVADAYGLGYDVETTRVALKGYTGTLELRYAKPAA
ncbi:DUF881 domain-containing protein [Nocardioides mangrovicus]|uniref:DUF881 domain-containing protein n=1 Tax=Nocardioides mangrovicus TaxID=2478913 RepID=UPI0013147E4F|nr:DUF881 domain-containing protein [Nocardioides mangrovicus]